ncbi:MAG: rhodanese-like domain-containing protein [Thiohalobacterales bacterium]|nr:rhodanese-like domain-containing protein [Thiohalobacterales bacterium]
MKRFSDLVADCQQDIDEVFPWDADEMLRGESSPLLVDIREQHEYDAMHIEGSLLVPRGILESACEYNYEETVRELVEARERDVIVVCRSGNRSALAAHTMQLMGYRSVVSMKTGLRGWNDYELPLVNAAGMTVPIEVADEFFTTRLRPDQIEPKG